MTGLARDAAMSRIFGGGAVTDAFFFAFIIPNLFRRLFGEGALAAAFIPVYAKLDKDDPLVARKLATITIVTLTVVLGVLTLAAEAVLFLVSRDGGHANLALRLLMIMLPYMPLVCLVAILGAMLQVHGRFGPSAAAPILLNVCVIAAAVALAQPLASSLHTHISYVAAAVIVAGLLQLGWMLFSLRAFKWWVRDVSGASEAVRKVLRNAIPMMIGLGVLQLNTFFDSLIASYPTVVGSTIFGVDYPLQEGAMSAVSFAQRLYQFPLGVFGIAVATAIFPALARQVDDADAFRSTLRRGLRLVVFIGLPASVGLMIVGRPLAAVILQGGEFGVDDVDRVAFVLLGYAVAVWAYSMIHVLTRAFFAKGDTATPVRVAIAMVALNLALNCTLIWTPLREAGLAWSTGICAILQVIVLTLAIRKHVSNLFDSDVVRSWLRSGAVTLVMLLVIGALAWLLPQTNTWLGSLGQLAALVTAGIATVVVAARVLRMPEMSWAIGRDGH